MNYMKIVEKVLDLSDELRVFTSILLILKIIKIC